MVAASSIAPLSRTRARRTQPLDPPIVTCAERPPWAAVECAVAVTWAVAARTAAWAVGANEQGNLIMRLRKPSNHPSRSPRSSPLWAYPRSVARPPVATAVAILATSGSIITPSIVHLSLANACLAQCLDPLTATCAGCRGMRRSRLQGA